MYENTLERLMRTIMLSLFVMLTKMDSFKLMITLWKAKQLHHQNIMSRKRLQKRGMIAIQEDMR